MQKSDEINELASALAKAQTELENVSKNKKNDFSGWKYADLPAILESIKPVLSSNGLSFSQLVGSVGQQMEITTILMHSSGQYLSSSVAFDVEPKKGNSMAQAAGATLTYFRRYSLTALVGISADDDTDASLAGKGVPLGQSLHAVTKSFVAPPVAPIPSPVCADTINKIEILWQEQYSGAKRDEIMAEWLKALNITGLGQLTEAKAQNLLNKLEDKKKEYARV